MNNSLLRKRYMIFIETSFHEIQLYLFMFKMPLVWCFLSALVVQLPIAATCQDDQDYYSENFLRYEDHVYQPTIHTVQLYRQGWELSSPRIKLNSNERLMLAFDDLAGYLRDFGYTFIHCDANWQPSDLLPVEFISGVPEDFIIDYKYSRNTIQKYIHYNLSFPNNNISLTKSGNYVLKVFDAVNPDSLVLTKRFMVVKEQVDVKAQIKPATIVRDRYYKQEIDFTINWEGNLIVDPFVNLKVVLLQNQRWDNAITTLQPVFVKNQELVYDYDEDNVFPGGNEFRFFNIKDLRYNTPGIFKITRDTANHVYLDPDEKRSFKVYLEQPDINGKRLIKIDDRYSDSEIDADYVYVYFSLSYPTPLADADIFVFGELSAWQFQPEYKLKYNYENKSYETSAYLKQGYYNYMYSFLKDGKTVADEAFIEGSHYETENDYTILVYYRPIGSYYDQLIAAEKFNSKRSTN